MDTNTVKTLRMYGPALDGSGRIVNRDVPLADVSVYQGVGYKAGSVPEESVIESPVKEAAAKQSDLDSMTKAELVEVADKQGLETKGMNKADILELLKAG